MTKKAEHAARVAANKVAAWHKRVRTLIGHMIHDRVSVVEMNEAYDAGKIADAFAAELASREPVGAAVHPLKVEAVESAAQFAQQKIDRILTDMAAHGWDLNKAAPYPASNMSREEYRAKMGKHDSYSRVTKTAKGYEYGGKFHNFNGRTDIREVSKEGCERLVQSFREGAAIQYDMFICKLVMKVGDVTDANLVGSHVWSESTLHVIKSDGRKEQWRTKQIQNVSKLGLYFPQWPTRLLK